MEIIKPSQISGEIMTLIDEADERVILVSPYFRISKWFKFLNKLEAAKKRNIQIDIYVREGEIESINEVLAIGLQPITVPYLHTKLYLSEKDAIVSSMNLLLSSDTNSLDIALKTQNEEEYKELLEYFTRYIHRSVDKQNLCSSNTPWREHLQNELFIVLGQKVYMKEDEQKLQIYTSNKYEVFVSTGKTNDLRISGILSTKEFEYNQGNKNIFRNVHMKVELIEGGKGHYNTIWGTLSQIHSPSINELQKDEEIVIVDNIINFIFEIEKMKSGIR